MNKKLGTAIMLILATLQVACGKNKKEKAIEAFTQQCAGQQPCIDMYTRAATNTQIAGLANTSGLPQVAAVGATVQPGQVPNTSVLPASITDAQVKSTAAKIQSQLQSLNAQANAPSTAGPITAASVSSEPTQVEVGVTRLSSPASATPAASNPSSLQLSSVAAPAAPEAVESGVSAGR